MNKIALIGGSIAALMLPAFAFAAINNLSDVGNFIINTINNIIVPVLFAIAFIVFLWGAFQTFIVGATDDTAKSKGKDLMLWGLIGFFVMVSVWGLVNIVRNTFNVGNDQGITGGTPKAGVQIGQ